MDFRAATIEDIDLLVMQRLNFIEVDEKHHNYDLIRKNCYEYFLNAFDNNTCDVILAEEEKICIGTGIIFYYDSVPSTLNITGKNAYVTSMYVEPNYRKRGIGTAILERLIKKVRERNCTIIMLNASEVGKPLYKKIGFKEIQNGMILNLNEI